MLKAFLSLLRRPRKPSLAQQRLEIILKANQADPAGCPPSLHTIKNPPGGEVPAKPNQYHLDTTHTTV